MANKITVTQASISETKFIPGDYYIAYASNEHHQEIVLCTNNQQQARKDCFCGVTIVGGNGKGHYSNGWAKDKFRRFNGNITIDQE